METYKIENGEITQTPIKGCDGFGVITSVKSSSDFKGIIHQKFRDVAAQLKQAGEDFMIATGSRTFNGEPIGIPVPSTTRQPSNIFN